MAAELPAAGDVEAAWRAVIARLYELTEGDRPGERVEGCTHCRSEWQERELAEVDRATAPAWLIDDFGSSAMLTWGDERDFRWFMPRLFEMLVTDPQGVTTAERLALTICMAGLDDWPDEDFDAVQSAYRALWRRLVHGPRAMRRRRLTRRMVAAPRPDPRDVLTGAAIVGLDVPALLDELFAAAAGSRAAAEDCAALAEWVAYDFEHALSDNAWPGERDVAVGFLAESTIAGLERLADGWAGEHIGKRLRDVAEHFARDGRSGAGARASTR